MVTQRQIVTEIKAEDENIPLLDYLTKRFTYRDKNAWLELIGNGALFLSNREISANTILRENDRIVFDASKIEEPDVDKNFSIVHECDDFIVIDKPGNLPVHPAGRYFKNTLWALLPEKVSFVNRLDRETSGLILCTKKPKIIKKIRAQISEKTYHVLTHNKFHENPIFVTGNLIADETSCLRKKIKLGNIEISETEPILKKSTTFSCTRLKLVKYCEKTDISLIEAKLYTGKTHQIRATLFSLGFPVVGDKIYGLDETFFLRMMTDSLTSIDLEKLSLPRQALHSYELKIGNEIFRSPTPKIFTELINL